MRNEERQRQRPRQTDRKRSRIFLYLSNVASSDPGATAPSRPAYDLVIRLHEISETAMKIITGLMRS